VNSAISGSPAPAAPPLLTSGSRKSSSNNTPASNAAALLQLTPRRRAAWSRALRSGLIGAYVSLLGAVSRMHAAARVDDAAPGRAVRADGGVGRRAARRAGARGV
jgi:hypothetical protein